MVAAQDPHAELLHRFRRYLEMEEGRSPRTAKEYLMDCALFSRLSSHPFVCYLIAPLRPSSGAPGYG